MASDKTPDDATGDSVTNAELIARVHAFLCALLTFLGFNALPNETTLDVLDTLTQWLADAKAIRRDAQGATAKIWWDAFKTMCANPKMSASEAAICADAAADEFGKRFLPVAEEDRDTLNTADFDAMRAELDQADRYRGEIVDAIDGRPGERAFMHPRIIDELRAERDTLLASNKHHATEIEIVRKERDELKLAKESAESKLLVAAKVAESFGHAWADELHENRRALIPREKPSAIEPGQRWAIIVTAGASQAKGDNAQYQVRDWHVSDGLSAYRFALPDDSQVVATSMYYLGTDKV